MESIILEEVSYFSSSEDYYKGIFMCAMLRLPKEYIRRSENETGYGWSDYEIYKEDKSVGMVYEFKVCSELKDAEKVVDEAIAQIHRKKYYTRIQKLGVKEIWLYGIVFSEQQMYIKKEKLEV